MEREKVIELVKQAGDIGDCYCQTIMVNDRDADDWVMAFARLVEQETLERAARLAKAYLQHGYDVTGNLELHEAILHKDFQDF